MSSPSGGSILITSAPTSASSRAQYGPASMIEKSSTRMPSSGIVVVPTCIDQLLSRQPKAALCNQTALNFVGADTDDPHQGMTEVLLKSAAVEGTRHLLGECRTHPEN